MSSTKLLETLTIKQEKPDSEKNRVERVTKSSSEILTELFGVFNAKPPEIKDSAVKHKKSKKSKKKHKKEKKKKKSKRYSDSDSSDSEDSEHDQKKAKKEKRERSRKRRNFRDEISLTPPRRSSPSPSPKRQKMHSFDEDPRRRVKINLDSLIVISKDNIRHKDKSTRDREISPVRFEVKKEVKDETIDIPVPNEADVSSIKLPEEKLETLKAAADSTTHQESSDKSGKGKIQIKNLKFSSVFEATVKQAEEQARKKAELYEDGEISDTSFSSDPGDEPDNNPEFPKSRDPGGILKGDLREIIASKEEKRASERKRSRSRDRKKTLEKIHHASDKVSSSSRSRKRSRSKSKTRRHSRSRERESKHSDSRSHHRSHRSRSRRRSTSKSRHTGHARSRSPASNGVKLGDTEKRRLLEVARRNALSMLRKGTAPIAYQQANKKLLAAIKSGGKSVDELTDFCKHLSKKEALGELSSLSSGDSELGSDNEDTMAFHHPFLVKDKGPIIMNIRGGVALPVKPSGPLALLGQNKEELVQQFPVSSGNDHRVKASEWRPVTPPPAKPPAVIKSKKQEVTHRETEKKITASVTAASAPQPVPPVPVCLPTKVLSTPATLTTAAPPSVPPPPPGTPALAGFTAGAGTLPQYNMAPVYGGAPNYSLSTVAIAVPAVAPGPQAYPPGIAPPQDTQIVDIGSIVSQRLSAIRKLQETCALNEAKVNTTPQIGWRNSEPSIGQFKGSTGAQILTPRELARGSQAWAKKDQLQRAAPVAGGMGMHLLQKMGWQPGQGLGKQGNGSLQPLLLEVKLDTKGLVAKEELKPLRPHRRGGGSAGGGGAGPAARASAAAGGGAGGAKHPVSLLGEYCSKHKHGAPEYTLCFECGPDHKKNFLFKVKVGGVEYQPSIASANKKQAKSDAAQIALQKLGIIT